MADRVAPPVLAEPVLDVDDGVEHGSDRSVAVGVNVDVEAGAMRGLDLRLDVARRERQRSPEVRRVGVRLQHQRGAGDRRAVHPHLADRDFHVRRLQAAVPVDELGRDRLRIVRGVAREDGSDDADRQLAAIVPVDEVLPDRQGGAVGRRGEHARVHVGGHPEGGRAIDRQALRGAKGLQRRHAERHHDREHRPALDRGARRRSVGVALVILLAGLRVGAVSVEPRRLHRRRVEPEVMRVCVEEVHRTIAGDLVEPLASRIVRAERHPRGPAVAAKRGVERLHGDPVADRVENRVLAHDAADVHAQLGDSAHGEMVVGVDEARHQHPPGEVHDPRLRPSPRGRAVRVADIDDRVSAHRHRFGVGPSGIDRVDRAVLKQPVRLALPRSGRPLGRGRCGCVSQRRRGDGGGHEGARTVQHLPARGVHAIQDERPAADDAHGSLLLSVHRLSPGRKGSLTVCTGRLRRGGRCSSVSIVNTSDIRRSGDDFRTGVGVTVAVGPRRTLAIIAVSIYRRKPAGQRLRYRSGTAARGAMSPLTEGALY